MAIRVHFSFVAKSPEKEETGDIFGIMMPKISPNLLLSPPASSGALRAR
jgi:hypothetical protein